MAQGTIIVPPDSTGKSLATDTRGDGAHMQDFVLYGADGNVIASASALLAGTEKAIVTRALVQGTPQTTDTGTITSATSEVSGSTDVSSANNATVIVSGTYAGVNLSFEASDDAGLTWVPVAGVRDDSGVVETATGVLPSNQTRAWNFGLVGYNRFRVRATAWTSGSASVIVDPGSLPFEPFVSNVNSVPNRISLVLATASAGVTPAATEALITMAQGQRGFTALSSGSSFPLTAGRIFRVQSMTILAQASTTTALAASAFLRFNPTGAATATSPIVAAIHSASPAAVAKTGHGVTVSFPDGKDLPGGTTPGQIGVSALGSTATGLIVVTVEGYEYG